MLGFLDPRELTQTAAVSSRLRIEAEHERLRRIEAVGGALPEAWRGGASEAVRVGAKTYDGFGLLRSYPDGSRVVGAGSAASTCEATVYGMPDGRVVGVLQAHKVAVKAVATDGLLVATADQKGVLRLHDAVTLAFLRAFKHGKHGSTVYGLALRGDTLISGSLDKATRQWSLGEQKCVAELLEHTSGVYSVDIGEVVATGSYDSTAKICWPLAACGPTGAKESRARSSSQHTLQHPSPVCAVRLAGAVLVTGCDDKAVRTWAVATGEVTRELHGHTAAVLSVSMSGGVLLSGSADKCVRVWSVAGGEDDGQCVAKLQGHTADVSGVALVPEGGGRHVVISLSDDFNGELIVWRPAAAEPEV
jgi:WD40 repeat protein